LLPHCSHKTRLLFPVWSWGAHYYLVKVIIPRAHAALGINSHTSNPRFVARRNSLGKVGTILRCPPRNAQAPRAAGGPGDRFRAGYRLSAGARLHGRSIGSSVSALKRDQAIAKVSHALPLTLPVDLHPLCARRPHLVASPCDVSQSQCDVSRNAWSWCALHGDIVTSSPAHSPRRPGRSDHGSASRPSASSAPP
jgi:hypothetical protein